MVKLANKTWEQNVAFADGAMASLKERVKKHLVLYFYPRANTPGCTNESKDFSEHYAAFQDLDCEVIGISMDSLKKQQNFKNKYDMPFELIADVDEVLCQAFDVIKEKNMYGKKFMGIVRSTFVLDREGQIVHEWRQVKVPGHVQEVLTFVKTI